MSGKLTVYLADLANTRFGYSPATVPLALGYLKAYAAANLPHEVDLQLFRTFETLYRAIDNRQPDIIGCAWYGWNRYLTTNALTYIKSRFPKILTVVGGANAPEKAAGCLRDLKQFPCLDMIIPGEGELPLVNLLKAVLANGKEAAFNNPIDGVFYLSGGQELVEGKPVPLVQDLDIFPSPYLSGTLDQFLAESDLMPIMQTSRGCPYHCTFCVSGLSGRKKVRGFALERVKTEMAYLQARARNRVVRFADDNFGLLPRDLELARFIADLHARTGYPHGIRLYTDKNINQRIKDIILLLKSFIPLNISFQTMTASVLKNIKRRNVSLDDLRQAIEWARGNHINVTSEIIFGLPGESYASFMEIISKLSQLRIDSVCGGPLMMLKETELNQPEMIDRYGYKVMYCIAERGYTKDGDFESLEIDRYAVANKYYNFNDYLKVKSFMLLHDFFMYTGYFKETFYMLDNRGVKITDVISEILDNPDKYPFISQKVARVRKCNEENLFETEEEVRTRYRALFADDYCDDEYIGYKTPFIINFITNGELIHPAHQEEMIAEVLEAAGVVFQKGGLGDYGQFAEETQFARKLIKTVIIPFWEVPAETVTLVSPYNLLAWANNNYQGLLSQYRLPQQAEYCYKINVIGQYLDFLEEKHGLPFYQQAEYFFRTFLSNNLRRFIVSDKREQHLKYINQRQAKAHLT